MSTDLFLTNRELGERADDRTAVDIRYERGDLKLVSDRENLAQAIINRLLTRQGELSGLGHPNYGSRLYQLVGEPNTRRAQVLADLYIRESLAAEDRIREITSISFAPYSPIERNVMKIQIVVHPADSSGPQAVSLALNLEG